MACAGARRNHPSGRIRQGRSTGAACSADRPSLKPAELLRRVPMVAILTVLIFIIAIGALNFFEFGRLD
ncbi:MAG: hypothetical protein LPJ86_07570 [Caulobacteraceae bacterium]|nr:hypothetical protein [Caulobacteraceae bacterium]MDX5393666.1 hypothetical protein [Caulobacteraceae bacterium]